MTGLLRTLRARLALLAVVLLIGCGGGGTPAGGPAPSPGWRSALFPADWTPAFTDAAGRYLDDASYAGYRNGEAPLPTSVPGAVFDVVGGHGADDTGATDATAAFQAAIDAASTAGGGTVHVPAGLYRLDGRLVVQTSGILLRGEGAAASRLHFTQHAGMTGRSHLTFGAPPTTGTERLLAADGAARSREVRVADATGLVVGTDVSVGWVITDAFVEQHGMTGTWQAFNGTWQPFFRRAVAGVDTQATPHRVTLDVPLRYDALVRDQASLRVESGYLSEVGVAGLGLANAVAWNDAWQQERVHVLAYHGVKDGWITDVASFASPTAPAAGPGAGAHLQNGGVVVLASKRVTVARCRMEKAQNRGGGGCGYLFEVRQGSELLTRDCEAHDGRHNFIQNWGFGLTGCVWLRCRSSGGLAEVSPLLPGIGTVGYAEFHHSLATANLVDGGSADDGWSAVNRGGYSSGAGHTATQNVFWNVGGSGRLRSEQYGWGYVIGTGPGVRVQATDGGNSAPVDWQEGLGEGATLEPRSLYEAQFRKRVGRAPETAP